MDGVASDPKDARKVWKDVGKKLRVFGENTVFKNWPLFNGRDRSCGIALFLIAARALRFAPANSARYRSQETPV